MSWPALDILPVPAWILLVLGAVFVAEYVILRVRLHRHRDDAARAEATLLSVATALQRYATQHRDALPSSLDILGIPTDGGVFYRPAPSLSFDERLILVHDAHPTRRIIEFPHLRPGRGLILCTGRFLVVTEDAYDKLVAADDALRDKLGLPMIPPPAPSTMPTHRPTREEAS